MRFFKVNIVIIVFTLMLVPYKVMAEETIVELRSGTPVEVRVVQDVSPATHNAGDRVMMVVNNNILVDGHVAIASGAKVQAEITKAKKKGYAGQAGEILFSFKTVEAIDGQSIIVSGSQDREGEDKMITSIGLGLVCCPLFLLMKGEEAIVKSGSTTIVYTIQTVKIKVKN